MHLESRRCRCRCRCRRRIVRSLVSQPLKPEPMTRTEFPSAPWQHLAADLLGPLPSGDYIFVVFDYYSRFFEVEFTKSITTEKIVSLMSKMLVTHDLPCSLRTGNGPQFVSDHFKGYLEKNGIECRRTKPLWPQANGEIERQNRTILKRLLNIRCRFKIRHLLEKNLDFIGQKCL